MYYNIIIRFPNVNANTDTIIVIKATIWNEFMRALMTGNIREIMVTSVVAVNCTVRIPKTFFTKAGRSEVRELSTN